MIFFLFINAKVRNKNAALNLFCILCLRNIYLHQNWKYQ
jgi:hypothetical protein